jgi:DnaJ-like protein
MPDPLLALDKIISDAQREGKFEDLPGKGKPLEIDTSPDAALKGVLKEANVSVTPEWITLAIAIDHLLEQGEQNLQRYAAAYAADRAAVMESPAPPHASSPIESPGPAPTLRGWRAMVRRWLDARPASLTTETRQAEAAAALRRRWERELARHAAWLHESNGKIRRFNQIVPVANRQRALLPVRERLEAFVERFPRPERAPDGGWQWVQATVPESLLTPPPEDPQASARARDPLQLVALKQLSQGGRRPPPIS